MLPGAYRVRSCPGGWVVYAHDSPQAPVSDVFTCERDADAYAARLERQDSRIPWPSAPKPAEQPYGRSREQTVEQQRRAARALSGRLRREGLIDDDEQAAIVAIATAAIDC